MDRLRRRIDRVLPRRVEAPPEGPFLRRMWQRRRLGVGPVVASLLIGWALYSLIAGGHGWLAIASLEAQRDRLDGEIAALEAQIGALGERLGDDTNDAFLLEKTARESYGLARPGEVVYRFDADAFAGEAPAGRPLAAGP